MRFQILSLSGGGFLGLYTAEVLAALEEESGKPLADRFDLIAGTSIGGILALGIAARKPVQEILDKFKNAGSSIFSPREAPQGFLHKNFELRRNAFKAKYQADKLREVIVSLVGEDLKVGNLSQRVIVPTVNLTKGSPQVFKTPHHPSFVRDLKKRVVDVALATSAAPTFFPIHSIGGELFADGGLYANSPDQMALHEAEYFLGQQMDDVHLLSIGTTTAHFSFSNSISQNMGWIGWMSEQRLPSVMIASQQMNVDFMVNHRLGERYQRIDYIQSKEQERYLALDVASEAAIRDLSALAEASIQNWLPKPSLRRFLAHDASVPDFNFDKG